MILVPHLYAIKWTLVCYYYKDISFWCSFGQKLSHFITTCSWTPIIQLIWQMYLYLNYWIKQARVHNKLRFMNSPKGSFMIISWYLSDRGLDLIQFILSNKQEIDLCTQDIYRCTHHMFLLAVLCQSTSDSQRCNTY